MLAGKYPYSPRSYYALEESYISIDKLKDAGLIKKAKIRPVKDRIKFDNFKEKYYKEAFQNFIADEEYKEFQKDKEIKRYVEYMNSVTGEEKEYSIGDFKFNVIHTPGHSEGGVSYVYQNNVFCGQK